MALQPSRVLGSPILGVQTLSQSSTSRYKYDKLPRIWA